MIIEANIFWINVSCFWVNMTSPIDLSQISLDLPFIQ